MNGRNLYLLVVALSLLLSSCTLKVLHTDRVAARGARHLWPAHAFTPYSYDAFQQADLVALSQAAGTKFFTLAFIEATRGKACQASWNGRQPIGIWMQSSIQALRSTGGDVSMAFGGSAGNELSQSCATVSSLQAQYRSVINIYHLTHLDFDIEGKALTDARAMVQRNRAIASLQKQFVSTGRRLSVSYTLPVNVSGLTPSGINLLRDAILNGVTIDTINLMTMDYYSKHAPGNRMGQNAIRAASSVLRQLQPLYPGRSASQLWSLLGLTPMIGKNDDTREIFTLQDAQTVLNFARQQNLNRLSFWSVQHDRRCTHGQVAPHGCSGMRQQPYQYSQAFAAFIS
jgi:chitinase